MDPEVTTEELIERMAASIDRAMAALDKAEQLTKEILELCSPDSADEGQK